MRSLVVLILTLSLSTSAMANDTKSAIEALRYCAKLKKMLPACKKLEVEAEQQKKNFEKQKGVWKEREDHYKERVVSLEKRVRELNERLKKEIREKPAPIVRKEVPGWVLPVVIVGGVVLLGAGIGAGYGIAQALSVR